MASKDVAVLDMKLPAHLRGAAVATKEFTGGVQSGFPVMSIRGRVWRVKVGGEEQIYTDENGDAVSSVELVLVKSFERPSKIHYDKKYEEGDDGKPRCFSTDGIAPATEVDEPISKLCATCPKNAWGSRITETGKKSRACSDVRRVAVVTLAQLVEALEKGDKPQPMLLRIPPASLNPLKEYAGDTLGKKGIQPYMVVSRCGFDNEADYPKVTFKPARFLSEEEYALVSELRDSEEVGRILATTEYSAAGTTGEGAEQSEASDVASAEATPAKPAAKPAPAASSKPAAAKPAAAKPAKPKKREATAAEAEAAAVASTPVVEAETVVEAEVVTTVDEDEGGDAGSDDFESMLSNILGE